MSRLSYLWLAFQQPQRFAHFLWVSDQDYRIEGFTKYAEGGQGAIRPPGDA